MTANHPRQPCSFQLVRYVPDPVRNEFVHIGVILRDTRAAEPAQVRFTRDWRRVRCMDPETDTALLESLETELRRRFLDQQPGAPPDKLLYLLDDAFSLSVQLTEPKAYLAENLASGLDQLMRLYVESPPRERTPRLRGRAALHAQMRAEFERAAVWDLLRKQIPAAQYTRPGDPLRIDCGYRPNGIIRMLHAVSLEAGVESAKILAFSSAALRTGIERVEHAGLELTAIVEPAARFHADREDAAGDRLQLYRFGVETMEEHQIRVLTTSDLERVAATARRELGVG